MKKKLLTIMAITLVMVTGCGVAKMENGQDAVVKLKEGDISINDLYDRMKDDYALNVLLTMIDTKILDKLYPSDAEEEEFVNAYVENVNLYYEMYKDQFNSLDHFIQSNYQLSGLEAYKNIYKLEYKRNKVTEAYAKEEVSEKEIKKYYDDKIIGDMEISHILIKVEMPTDATDEEKEKIDKEAYDKAASIIAELNEGKKFADLAKKYGQDGTASKGGSLGWINREGYDKTFVEASIKLAKGKYTTEPVKTEFGYHIILKTDQKAKPKYESINKEDAIEIIAEENISKDTDKLLNGRALIALRKDHNIDIQDSELKKQYDSYKARYDK